MNHRYFVYIDDKRDYQPYSTLQEAADSIDYFTLRSAHIIRIHDTQDDIWYRVTRSDMLNAVELERED